MPVAPAPKGGDRVPPPPSCPRLSRASTSFFRRLSKQDVDGRDRPGHDSGGSTRPEHALGARQILDGLWAKSRQPPAQYEHPASWARFNPHVPDGITVIPGMMLAAHSFAATSALTPALPASILLWTCSATLHAPKTTPLARSRSTAMSSNVTTPALERRNEFFLA